MSYQSHAGYEGMVGGQMLDLEAEKKKLNLREIYNLQRLKTGEFLDFPVYLLAFLQEKK